MSVTQAVVVAVLCAVGVYLLMERTLVRVILGVGLLGNGINLLIMASGGPVADAPIIAPDGTIASEVSDPVPQALVLTAIVIGMAVISFLLAIAYRSWTIDGNDEVEDDISDRRVADG